MIDFTMPRYGFMQKGTVTRWFKNEGEAVSRGELLVQVESDKVVNDVESPADGFLKKIVVPAGGEQEVFKSIALIAESREELELVHEPREAGQGFGLEQASAKQPSSLAKAAADGGAGSANAAKASPVARKLAREHDLDLQTITGSGPGGRITERDVQAHIARESSQRGPAREEELSATRKAVAFHLTQGLQRSALVTHSLLCRCEALLAIKKEAGVSISTVLVKLLGTLLAEQPHFNAHLIDDRLLHYKEVNIGIAVHTAQGLLVPVVRKVGVASLGEIQEQLKSLADRARNRMLARADMQGSTFTLSNVGMYKTDVFTPILNFPEVGILGVGRIFRAIHVHEEDERTSIASKVWLSLSYDHRAIDGVQAAGFLGRLEELLGDLEKLSRAVRQARSGE